MGMAFDAAPPPPIPPRPRSAGSYIQDQASHSRALLPPVPPLPPGLRPHSEVASSHAVRPLLAPQLQQLTRDYPGDMMHALDERSGVSYNNVARFASPPPLPTQSFHAQEYRMNPGPAFIPYGESPYRGPSPAFSSPPITRSPSVPAGMVWKGGPPADVNSVSARTAGVSFNELPVSRIQSLRGVIEHSPPRPHVPSPRSSPSPATARLAGPLPNIETLQKSFEYVRAPTADVASRVAWIRDVLFLVNRANASPSKSSSVAFSPLSLLLNMPSGRINIEDPGLSRLTNHALTLLINIMPTLPAHADQLTPALAEALYIRAKLTATGLFPEYIPASPRNAFREFEVAARGGHARAWFRLGRDYESFNDATHARQCFEKGLNVGDVACMFRMGVARLLGQLNFPADSIEEVEHGVQLLHRAATMVDIEFPEPAFVFALFLRDEFEQVSIPVRVLAVYVPAGSTPALEARRHLERAAYFHYAPAQQRIGHAYEFAEDCFPSDPVLSVEYYSLASAGGDAQSDLALSKWYLCGAKNAFGKDERRAREYAARGASRGLPGAKFAMGYCYEVGIDSPPDIARARAWYEEAAALGDADAEGRLKALAEDSAPLSRDQHNTITEAKLVRSRTQTRFQSDIAASRDPARPEQAYAPQEEHVYQQRQVSLPPHMSSFDRYSTPSPPFQHERRPQHAMSLPAQLPGDRLNEMDYASSLWASSQGQSAQFGDQPRFSLMDPGVAAPLPGSGPLPSGARRVASTGAHLPPMRRHIQGQSTTLSSRSARTTPRAAASALPSEAGPRANTTGTRYNTFAEMGIEGKRAEDKDCCIM